MRVFKSPWIAEIKFNVSEFTTTGLTISDTAKPDTAQISHDYTAIAKPTAYVSEFYNGYSPLRIRRFAFKTTLSATNSDSVDHTLNYEIYVDGSLAVSGSFTVPASGSASKTEVYAQVNPTDNTATIEIYLWADTADVITVDETTIAGVGSESTDEQEVFETYVGGDMALYVNFGATGSASYTWVMRSYYCDARIAYYTDDDLAFDGSAPPIKVMLYTDTSGEIAYVTGIVVMAKPW